MAASFNMSKKTRVAVFSILVFLLAILLILVINVYANDKIHRGINSYGVSLSGLDVVEAETLLLDQHAKGGTNTLELVFGSHTKTLSTDELSVTYLFDRMAENAQLAGRRGNIFVRMWDVARAFLGGKNIEAVIVFDEAALMEKILETVSDIGEKVEEYTFEIKDDKLLVTTGRPGIMPDEAEVAEAILNAIKNHRFNRPLVFEKKERKPENIHVDKLYEQVYSTPQDARYEVSNNKVSIIPHVSGKTFDKEQAAVIIKNNRDYGIVFEIPLELSMPDVLTSDLEGKIFNHKLSQYTTRFDSSNTGRTNNIALSSRKINGTVLLPGGTFSYNDIVGARTYDEGFSTAKIYVNGEVVDGVGGGICQVSSTLYSAVLYANLSIAERLNHQLTVGYIPLGQDATVAYGSIDFKFKNNTDYPIKIITTVKGGVMHAEIWGHKTDPSLQVTIENITTRIINPTVKEIPDPTLPLGERKVVTKGTTGAVVDSYKTVKKSGADPVKTFLSKSTYYAGMEVVHVGTGPEATPAQDAAETVVVQPSNGASTAEVTPSPAQSPVPSPTATENIETPTPEATDRIEEMQ